MKQMNEMMTKLTKGMVKYKYALLVLVFGLALMLFPARSPQQPETDPSPQATAPAPVLAAGDAFDVTLEEQRLETVLSAIKGAGECRVLLSVWGTEETELAQSGEGPLVLSDGGAGEKTVTLRRVYPRFEGAVIVSTGAQDPVVKYDLLNAVMTYTGLRSDQITICA